MEFAKKEWQDALSQFSDDIFNQAVLACRDYHEMPPTLTQFVQICRDTKKRASFVVAKTDFKRADPVIVQTHIQRCKAILAGQYKESNAC